MTRVKALALYFQEKSCVSGQPSQINVLIKSPDVTSAQQRQINQENHKEKSLSVNHDVSPSKESHIKTTPTQNQTSFPTKVLSRNGTEKCPSLGLSIAMNVTTRSKVIPVPKPRLSLLRKQLQDTSHGTCVRLEGTDYRKESTTSCPQALEQEKEEVTCEDGYEVSRSFGDSIIHENYYVSDEMDSDLMDELDDIYEELPAEYHDIRLSSTRSLDRLLLKKKLRTRKSSISAIKERVLSVGRHRLVVEAKNSKFFPFPSRPRPVKELKPKPPSVDELDRPFRAMSLQTCSSWSPVNEKEQTYYDIRELGSDGTGAEGRGTASDEYFDGFESEGIYENVYNSSSNASERTYESLTGEAFEDEPIQEPSPPPVPMTARPKTSHPENVEYAEIDRLKTEELERKIAKEQVALEKKRRHEADKLRKKYHLTGLEVPVNHGVVKEDARRTRFKIKVKKGEIVLILRMENNPPGLWLAKNERSEIGYVELANISCDADTVRTLMLSNPEYM